MAYYGPVALMLLPAFWLLLLVSGSARSTGRSGCR